MNWNRRQVGWLMAADLLLIAAFAVVLILARMVDTQSYQFRQKTISLYQQLHTPIVPIVRSQLQDRYSGSLEGWKKARWVFPTAIHIAALANTWLLGTLAFALAGYVRSLRRPRLSERQIYGLNAWAHDRASYPFRNSRYAEPLADAAKQDVLRLQVLLDNPATALESLVEQRHRCLLHLPAHGRDGFLQFTLGEATLAIADRSSVQLDEAACALGWRWVEEAYKQGLRDPRIWATILKWGHDRPALVLEAEEKARQVPQLQGLLQLHQIRRRILRADDADLAVLQAMPGDDPLVLAYQAVIQARLGRRQEALELRWRLMRLKPLSAAVWRTLQTAYDEQEQALLTTLDDGPASIAGPSDPDWLFGGSTPRLDWRLGALIGLAGLLLFSNPNWHLGAKLRSKGPWRPETLTVLDTVALLRVDGSRIPWVSGYPPWLPSYSQQEALDFQAYTAAPAGFTVTLRPDGVALIGAMAPPEYRGQAYANVSAWFDPVAGNAETPYEARWTFNGRWTEIIGANGKPYVMLQRTGEGIQAAFHGRQMAVLLGTRGPPPPKFKWTDWWRKPELIYNEHMQWVITRSGRPQWLSSPIHGVHFGYNINVPLLSSSPYAAPDGTEISHRGYQFESKSWPGGSVPSTNLIFP